MKFNVGGKKEQSSTNASGSFDRTDTPQVPDWIDFRTQSLDRGLAQLGGMNPLDFVADVDPLQTLAAGGAANLTPRTWNYDGAADLTRGVAGMEAPTVASASLLDGLDKYMSPYTGQVVDAALADFDYGAGQTRAQQALEMAGAGAFGGSGSAITRAQTEDALNRGRASTSATLRDEGFRVGAGLSESDAGRRQAAAMASAQLEADNRQRQLAAAQQLANLSGQLGAEERAIVGTQAGIGDMMRTIAGEEAMAPADALAREIALLAGLNPGLFIGNRSTGTETKSTKTKGSGLAAGLEFAYGQKD